MLSEQELISQLNNLKNIKADKNWKDSNRSVLINQIYGASAENKGNILFNWREVIIREMPMQMLKSVSRPVATFIIVFVFMGSTVLAGSIASRNTKPGDSLYAAKIATEKTQFALTFNESAKAKLNLQFASNRAEEINRVLAESDGENKEEKVENLVNNFKKEISAVRSRIDKMQPAEEKSIGAKDETKIAQKNNTDEKDKVAAEEDGKFFSADAKKDDKGIEVSSPANTAEKNTGTTSTSTVVQEIKKEEIKAVDTQTILMEAQNLFDSKDYNAAIDKLEEADKAINNVSETEQASTTQNISPQETDLK